MENKRAAIMAGTGLTLAALTFCLFEVMKHDALQQSELGEAALQEARRQSETRPLTSAETARLLREGLGVDDELQRLSAIGQLAELFEEPFDLDGAQRESLAEALAQAWSKTPQETPDGRETRAEIARLLIGRVGGEPGKALALELLSSSSETARGWAAEALALQPAAVRGREVAQAALEAVRSGSVPAETRPALLRRFLGRKAEPELSAMLSQELPAPALRACAVELQNVGGPGHMGTILARLETAGLLGDPRKMPWLSARLLSEHIRTASKDELARAVSVVKARPRLARAASKALRQRLGDPDSGVRRMVAQVIPGAVEQSGLDGEEGLEMLVAQLQREDDPAVKEALEEGVSSLRLARQPEGAAPAQGAPGKE